MTEPQPVGVAIVGAGFAGLYTLRECLRRGLDAWVFEKTDRLGGVWNVLNKPGGVFDFTFSVTSRLYLSNTELPPPADYPEFPHASLVFRELERYAERFGLRARVRFGHEVVAVARRDGGADWEVRLRTDPSGGGPTVRAARLVIATGTNMCPAYPADMAPYRRFRGPVIHAHHYGADVRALCAGKRVLIVGGSDTASDIAADVARVARLGSVFVSIPRGVWFQDRMGSAAAPADMFYSRLVNWLIKRVVGKRHIHDGFADQELRFWWGRGGSDVAAWQPRCDYLNAYYNKSRDVVRLVGLGAVVPCGAVEDIRDDGRVRCAGRADPFEVDVILLCTGYRYADCLQWAEPWVRQPRYVHVFPPDPNPSLAFVGYIRPYLTSIPMLIELQARLVAAVFAGRVTLPPAPAMARDAAAAAARTRSEFACSAQRIPFIVDPYDYCDRLGTLLGAVPPWWALLARDPLLWYCCWFDSWNPYVYRLCDEDAAVRATARAVILEHHHHPSSVRIRERSWGNIRRGALILGLVLLGIYTQVGTTGHCPHLTVWFIGTTRSNDTPQVGHHRNGLGDDRGHHGTNAGGPGKIKSARRSISPSVGLQCAEIASGSCVPVSDSIGSRSSRFDLVVCF